MKLFYFITFLCLISCTPIIQENFQSIKLESSKGEILYINSVNWGVTDDKQRTIITKNKNELKNRISKFRYIENLSPFIYHFNGDTLKVIYDGKVRYRAEEKFNTIVIEYVALESKKYDKLRIKAFENDGYHCVPHRIKIDYPSDMPLPPAKKND